MIRRPFWLWLDPVFQAALLFAVMGLVLHTSGCSGAQTQLDQAARAVRAGAKLASMTGPLVAEVSRVQQLMCLYELPTPREQDECIAKVRAHWAPFIEAVDEIRAARCALEEPPPDVCAKP